MSSVNHDDFAHLKIPLEIIQTATNNFAKKNFWGEDDFGKHYLGQLLWSGELIKIQVRRWLNEERDDEKEQQFWMEIFMLSTLKHKNLVSIVGFCDENDELITVIKLETRFSLDNYLSDLMSLTWVRRLEICVGVARALSYIHYDEPRDFSVIHRNIDSATILLNDNWEPKLSDFQLSMKIEASQRLYSFRVDSVWSTKGYTDPTYIKTNSVNHKSDMYSFGIVMFELLCGRESIIADNNNKYLVPLAITHYIEKKLHDVIDPDLWRQMDPQSLNIFAETAYDCLNEDQSQRPNIEDIVTRLGKALSLQLERENAGSVSFISAGVESHVTKNIKRVEAMSGRSAVLPDQKLGGGLLSHQKKSHLDLPYARQVIKRLDIMSRLQPIYENLWKNLEHLNIALNDIKLATENFADKYRIGEGGYAIIYKAQLEHFDSNNSSSIEGKNKCDLPKKCSTVAIKRIRNQEGEQGFLAEIEILTSCRHENIISLLGFCDEDPDHPILVYELASKGSLADYMGNSNKMTNLTWVQRLKICLDIAHGMNYIHTNTDHGKQKIIHRDIKSMNILLGDNWNVKISDFGSSFIIPADQEADTLSGIEIAGTQMYLDPEYEKYGRISTKSDIYSFGVVLLEILTGRLAYDYAYENGIAPIARDHFEKGTLMEIVDHKIKEETDEHVFSLSKGPNDESLDIFTKIAFRCLAMTQVERPSIDVVINELKKALYCQENHKDSLKLSLQDIKLATETFNQDNLIGHGDFGNVYKGYTHGHNFIAAKRLGRKSVEGEAEFMAELEILMQYKHENVIGLVGYCDEEDEKIIVYEYASRGSLDKYLSDDSLTWVMRLKICIDIAIGLEFLHGTVSSPEMVIHRDISSSNILLLDDWKAKISDFGHSLVCPTNQDVDYVIDNVTGTIGYRDPLYSKTGFLTKESDIFSLGAVLFDILCGKLSSEKLDDEYLYLPFLAKHHYYVKKLDKLVFEGIKEQIVPQSYITFTRIALKCLHHRRERRPTAHEVVIQLKKALEFQEDYEKWELKLPTDYKEIIQMSKCPEIYSTIKKEDLYNFFSKGILLQQDKVLLSFDGNGERNKMVSATMFCYINSCPHEWKSLQESRFETVVEMFDISKLNIEIKTNAQLLSPNVVYGVYLIFKLSDSRKFSTKPMCVNLKYRKGLESLHAYFATWRDKDWMMIELYQFLNQNEDVVFEFLLESFSSHYCGENALYVEGIEFRAIDKGSVSFISAGVESHVTKNIKRVDAKYKKTIGVTHKSNVYSFRVVLSAAMRGRSAVLPDQELGEGSLSQLRKSDFDKASRVLQTINENPELPMNAVDGTSSNYNHLRHSSKMLQWKNLEHLKIGLDLINEATKNFANTCCIGSGGFGKVYKADLEHFVSSNSSSIEGVDKCDLPRKRSTVAIKRLNNQEAEQGFIAEIECLANCKHENIISLLGFCYEGNGAMILVYEHASKGSLDDYLGNSYKITTLTWVQRLKICLDIAHGMNYIHNNTDHGKRKIIHRDIKSSNILLGDNWDVKISDFGLSFIIPADQEADTLNANEVAGTPTYLDPEYEKYGRMSTKSDIYSFGVVLLEILTGRLAYDPIFYDVNKNGIAPIARDHFEKRTLMEIVDPKIKEEIGGHVFSLSEGPNKEPLDIFTELAFRCVAETQAQRPTTEFVINELKKALYCQIMSLSSNDFAHLYVPLEDILSATNNFADENLTREDGFANEYRGQLSWSGELISIAARRLNKEWDGGEQQFWMEISMLSSLKHKNLVSLVGFCDENGEKIIVNEHQTRGSLSNYLSDPLLTWERRLEIYVGLAHALSYIHYDESREFSLIHRDVKSYSVLLNDNWEPKLCDFEISMKTKSSQRHLSFNDTLFGTKGYTDPAYINTHSVSHKSDLYSFGIVLFELLCSRKSVSDYGDNKYLAPVATFHYKEKILDDIIDLGIRKQMDPQSLNVFADTAYACLNEEPSQRPNIDEIVTRLKNALKLQPKCQKTEHSIAAAEVEVEGTSSSHDKGSVNFVSTRVISGKKTMSSSLKDFSRFKLSMEDMKSATNGLAPENIIRESSRSIIYEDRLLHPEQFDIIGKYLLPDSVKDESKKFWTEILMLSSLKHKNLVSLIGYVDEEDEKIIIYKREANGSLSKHLSNQTLTWMQRLKICLGVAKALSYIHYDVGRNFSVIHCNIKSSKILLDDKWEPKLSGFQLSLKNTVARRLRLLLTRDINKNAYLDPIYRKTGGVTHKSDVYSFGVVLFEVLCGRSAVLRDEDELGEGFLSQLKKSQLDDMIDQHLKDKMDADSLKIFLETAYCCIKEERADRPYIDQVVNGLEKALKLQSKYENPEPPRNAIDSHLKWKNLEHLKIALNDIESATENFADKCCIGEGGFGKVYKAQLEHFDSSNSSSIDGENKCGFPKKQSTVAIKRITSPKGEQGFNVEIETLTSCKHENIISLLGFCYEGPDHMFLVYELASKGSLEDYLGSSDQLTNLTWMQRLKICLDVAYGLNYIHTNTEQEKQTIIHRDIKSANILLGDNWEAKIADFGLSKLHPTNQEASTLKTDSLAGTNMYWDPEYQKFGRLNKKSDIYSFGVVLFEILTGRVAYDRIFTNIDEMGIAPIARHHFEKGTLMEIVDHKIKEETDEHVFSLSKGPNDESLEIFTKIAFRCIAMTQVERPSIDVVINELKIALSCQENHKDSLKLSLKDIKQATQNFRDDTDILLGHGDSGKVYRGVATHTDTNKHNIIAAKRLDWKSGQGEAKFLTELDILLEYKHDNVIGLVGYCDEEEEKVIVYEFASRGSLDRYLSDVSLTWVMRLKICIDIANGLEFLHGTASSQQVVIHRDISSSNILLFDDWKAKITDFGLSLVCPINQDVDYVIDDVKGTIGYCDPLYETTGFLTKESDIFSLGAVLFDILCGKLSSVKLDDEYQFLPFLAKHRYQVGKLDELVFEGIKGQIVPRSYITFTRIALQCLHHRRERRPTAGEVIKRLKEALEFQEDHELWEPKLPKGYKEIIQMSKCPDDYFTIKKEDLYNTFTKGILLQQDKVLSFDGDGKRNELVSAKKFTYVNRYPHKWRSLKESRFEKVAEMSDISKLNIEIETDTRLLSPNIVYGVYLVFKLCDSRKFSTKPMYVNLKYRKGNKTLQAYFATQRDDNWMMIELYRFLNQNKDVVFKFLLESFSSYYCGDGAIYIEGIEFRAIDKVKHYDIGYLKEVQVLKSNFNVDHVQQLPTEEIFEIHNNYDELFWLGEVNGKKLLVLSAKAFSDVDLFTSKPSAQSRFQEVIELLPQQVFYINCTFRSQMLSLDTEYVCYLVFKISEEYQGLHNPVRVRDLLREKDEEAEFFIYFITPSQFNIHDFCVVPKQREDGWIEIQLWRFNSTHELKHDALSINMKFTSLEGMLSGLIICGLEFRPM